MSNDGSRKTFLIGIAGGTCCGKSEVCKKICTEIEQSQDTNIDGRVIIVSHKSFYRELKADERKQADEGSFNFDHPSAFDDTLALNVLKNLKNREPVKIPVYNYSTHTRQSEFQTINPADVILFEGILILYNKDIRALMDMKIFVDTDCDTRLARRVLRDTVELNRDIDKVLNQYVKFVKRSFEDFALPTKKYADVIIPRGVDNSVAIELIVQHIEDILNVASKKIRKRTISENFTGRPH